MDAAGKDGTLKHVMSGVNPQGCKVTSFKAPSSEDLDHDCLWRCMKCLPNRGHIGIFNRSYYEETLVVRVHPEYLGKQKVPPELITKKIWEERFQDIRSFERYLSRNGILSNAQAAEHYLAEDAPDLAQVREILADIVTEDERAGEVIRRLRLLLKKGEVQQQPLDANEVVLEVLKLAGGDLTSHGVTVDTALAADLPAIFADRVQLQQVLLNLVMNACDAMADNDAKDRRLTVRTHSVDEVGVRIEVSDVGSGLPAGGAERAFERYFTTKAHGLGLGLWVCRRLITAHGGTLGAADNAERGATFYCALPLTREPRA
jgi:signal transduction histidine kinase